MIKYLGLFLSFTFIILANDTSLLNSKDDSVLWVAIFALGTLAIIILYTTSKRVSNIKKMHQDVLNRQTEMEKNQTVILTSMTEKIHNIALETHEKQAKKKKLEKDNKFNIVNDSQDPLLDITNDLIDYLRLKSKKVEISIDEFNLNNVLNEVSGMLASRFKGSRVELIFDIDKSVPRYIKGDSQHFGQILLNLLDNRLCMLSDDELRLEISTLSTYDDQIELQFQLIDNGAGMSKEDVEKLFVPYYDEKNGIYSGLSLFVAQELIEMMHGDLSIHSNIGRGTSFTISIPFSLVDPNNKRKYRLPDKILTDKKVFIVDSNNNSAQAIKKMFAYFKHDVTVVNKNDFENSLSKLYAYDIVVLEEDLLTIAVRDKLKEIKNTNDLKVVSLFSLMNASREDSRYEVVDKNMYKPLNQERVFEMIIDMYALKTTDTSKHEKIENDGSLKVKVHRATIQEASHITQDSFSIFAGKKLLIVEDNEINQKVLVNILNVSNMEIFVASNGVEAVKMVKESINTSHYDLVLMDINMPVMDGFAATKAIRALSEFNRLPIVAFTALVLDSEKEKMFKSGINAFLAKPLIVGKLFTVMSMFIETEYDKLYSKSTDNNNRQLPGIDIGLGITHSNNSEVLYQEILKEFVEAYGSSDHTFEKLINEHRYEQLKMLCLDIKGLSGTIGAKEMSMQIVEVHRMIMHNKHNLLPNYIAPYKKELRKIINSIEMYLSGSSI